MDFGLLQTIGVDEREVMARFMNNEGLYCRILKKFMEDKSYDELKYLGKREIMRQLSVGRIH